MEFTEQQEATSRQVITAEQAAMNQQTRWDFSDLRALFINCTLKRSPEVSNTRGLADISMEIMRRQGVTVDVVRAIDHDIATGVWPNMTEHGWARDDWPAIYELVQNAHILVLCTRSGWVRSPRSART
jgi:NADPH-dependent FMN reductase